MKACDRFESAFSEGGIEATREHASGCDDCRWLLDLDRDLRALGTRADLPTDGELDGLRRRVLGAIAREPGSRRLRPILAAAAVFAMAALLVAGGFLAGRSRGSTTTRLVAAIRADAASNEDLADVEDSRFTYSSVSLRRSGRQRVALEFDVTTHVRLEEAENSPLVRELLVHALLHPASTGERLKAMSFAGGELERKVRDALVFALRRDESPAVRLQALTILSDHLRDPEVEASVLEALRDDEAVPVRLLALEALASRQVDRKRLRQAIRQGERPGDEALRVRLAEYEARL